VRFGARCGVLALALAALLLAPRAARAIPLDALDTQRAWRLGKLRFEGNRQVSSRALRDALVTRPRRWFVLWQQRPLFDPYTFRTDLGRIRALYRSHGFYHAVVTSSVEVPEKGDVVNVTVSIEEGTPIRVTDVDLDVEGTTLAADEETVLRRLLPLEPGDIFEEDRYERGRSVLRDWFRQKGYARVTVEKSARVDVRDDTATVRYRVDPGPPSVFGPVTISGLDQVDADVVRREVTFKEGEPFQQSLLDKTRKNIDALHLFRSVRLVEDSSREAVVAINIAVAEAERHEVKLGVGYETEEGIRGTAGWRDYSFLGGARQLGVSVRISQLYRTIAADFLQPHFPSQTSRVRLIFVQEQTQDTTYTLNETRVVPRLEWEITPRLTSYAFYRASLNLLPQGDIKTSVRKALPQAHPSRSVTSGLGFGVDLNETDDLVNPTRGGIARFSVEPVGAALGGDVDLYRVIAEGRLYVPLPFSFGAAGRTRFGSEDETNGSAQIPLFERFYAGGISSVRGYSRRRVGPLASQLLPLSVCNAHGKNFIDCDEPVGGKSLVEVSAELRRPVTDTIDVIGFLDAGQVSLRSWNFPVDDLQYGLGVGARYRSVIGPLRVDLGFPLDKRGDDSWWQVYLAVGDTF
jgi:outer membrane protein insertion porin family/translocation and assembly module TamA